MDAASTNQIADILHFNPNKAGLFEGSSSWGKGGAVNLKKNLFDINKTLHNC